MYSKYMGNQFTWYINVYLSQVVVLCDPRSNVEINRVNEWCRNTGAQFIMGNARGLFSTVFCDFGKEFIVNDVSGIEPEIKEIVTINKVIIFYNIFGA